MRIRKSSAAFAAALLTSGCAATVGTGPPPTVSVTSSQIAQDVALIASSAKASLPVLAFTTPPIPPAMLASVTASVNAVQTDAALFAAATTPAGQEAAVVQLALDVGQIGTGLSGITLTPQVAGTIVALNVLVAGVEIAVGVPPPSVPAPAFMTAMEMQDAHPMTVEQARRFLQKRAR